MTVLLPLLMVVGLQPVPPVYFELDGLKIGYFEGIREDRHVAIVEPLAPATLESRADETQHQVKLVLQRVRVYDHGTPGSEMSLVEEENDRVPQRLSLGTRYFVVYRTPRSGKLTVGRPHEKRVSADADEATGLVAVRTMETRLGSGSSFEDVLFASYIGAMRAHGLEAMMDLAERCPRPFGASVPGRSGSYEYRMNGLLNQLSVDASSQGGLFNVVFHLMLVRWNLKGSEVPFLDALIAESGDARLDVVLREMSVWQTNFFASDLVGTRYADGDPEAAGRLVEAAARAKSVRAAAILAYRVARPLEDCRQQYLALLSSGKDLLSAAVCNRLAARLGRRERVLPFEKDADGWEQRVAETSQAWLRELGG